jgi:hypothetical protein
MGRNHALGAISGTKDAKRMSPSNSRQLQCNYARPSSILLSDPLREDSPLAIDNRAHCSS